MTDFPETRAVLDTVPSWVEMFAARLPTPERAPVKDAFRWEHPTKDAETVQVAKAVRIASGLRAAMALADLGHTVECGTLLRTVADFSAEILFLGEGLLEGRLTEEQRRFVEQHFQTLPLTPDELAAREREYYVSRKEMAKAHGRMMQRSGNAELFARVSAFLNKGYDSYVHGAYSTAMELFTGRTMSFMMKGHESARHACMAKVSVAGKLKEALNAFRLMAITRAMRDVHRRIGDAYDRLDASGEDAGLPCRGLA